jgi:hypothetical protein
MAQSLSLINQTTASLRTSGGGGRGVEYPAMDTKLGRDIALKMLPSVFA